MEITVTNKAVLLQDEFASAICEYSKDNLLIACLKTNNLFNFRGFQDVTEVVADDQEN